MNFSSHDTARRCRLDSFLSVHASTVVSPTAFFRHLFNRCLIGSISRHAFNLCLANAFLSVHATLCLLNCCQAAFASSTVVVPLSPVIRCQTSVVLHSLSALFCLINRCQLSVASSPVVVPLLAFTRCRAVGWKGLFALCFAFSPDEWTRSGNESVAQEMDFVESRWK